MFKHAPQLFFFAKLVWLKIAGKTTPLTVIFNVTNSCNLRCKHCYASYYTRDSKHEMTTAQIKKVIDEIKNIKCLTISLDGKPKHHDILRGKGSAAKALEAIKVAKNHGIEVRVNMVVHKFNLKDLEYML